MNRATGTRIEGVKILNPSSGNGDDEFNLVSSSDVILQNIFVRTNDDCVVVKNVADVDTHDITVRHAVLWNMPNGGNGLEIGFETRNHTIHDMLFEDVDMIHIERGAAISIHNGDPATVEDVSFKNIRVEDVRRKLIDFTVLFAQYGPDRPTSEAEVNARMDRGSLWDGSLCYMPEERSRQYRAFAGTSDIRVENLQVIEGALPFSVVSGFDAEHSVEGISIRGLSHLGRQILNADEGKFSVDHARGVTIQ